jgi:hypothetical protein
MSEFLKSKQFREAWMKSILAAAAFPFLMALIQPGDGGYFTRVNQGFLKIAFSFGAVFFAIQFVFATVKYSRVPKATSSTEKTKT